MILLLFLCLQANADMIPKIPSCYCMHLMEPSLFKFVKLKPLALKSPNFVFQIIRFSVKLVSKVFGPHTF